MLRSNDGTQTKRLAGLPGDRYPTTGFQKKRALYTATGGETSINLALLSPALSYMPGMSQIAVKRSSGGGALIAGIDFLETNTTTITFPTGDPLVAGEIVEISQEAMVTGIAALAARPDCYTATATALQTLVTADFSWQYGLNPTKSVGGVMVYVQGSLWKRGVDYTEVNLGTTNTNQILVADGFIGGEDIVMLPAYQAIDVSSASSSLANQSLASLQSMMTAGSQGFIDQSSDMVAVQNTTIVGRAKIPNLANDIRASLGVERILTQSIMQLQNEVGASGEPVFAAVNDDRGLIRFVGNWYASSGSSLAYGAGITCAGPGYGYVEVTFYGTGINLLYDGWSSSGYYPTIDGGIEQSVLVGSSSAIIAGRNYSPNVVLTSTACHGLSLGVHTVKFRNAMNVFLMGFEILNANASGLVNINPGTGYINGQKYVNALTDSVSYKANTYTFTTTTSATVTAGATYTNNGQTFTVLASVTSSLQLVCSGTGAPAASGSLVKASGTGTDPIAFSAFTTGMARGGRIVHYLNSDGTVGQAYQAVNSAAATLTSTDHTNEEVARTYHWREFGAGRNPTGSPNPRDDFSTEIGGSVVNRAFTLDDGTTTLVGNNVRTAVLSEALDVINSTTNGFITLTFVGTGLDIVIQTDVTTRSFTGCFIDGGSTIGAVSKTGSSGKEIRKIVSGLAYGTHTVKLENTSAAQGSPSVTQFIVYQPKKPTLPSTALELCDYNVMAALVGNSTAGIETISQGVLRKEISQREAVYVGGGWALPVIYPATAVGGWQTYTGTATQYFEYTFFGTGFEVRSYSQSGSTWTIQVDGAYPSAVTYYGGFNSYTAGSGALTSNASTAGSGYRVVGLTLGVHKVKVALTSGTYIYTEALDIITPIHAVKSNLYADLQNTLPVGSCSLMDSRKTSMIKEILPAQKAWAQAVGLATVTTSAGSGVPMPDMSITIKTSGGPLFISYCAGVSTDAVGGQVPISIYVDGVTTGFQKNMRTQVASYSIPTGDQAIVPVSAGTHKVDLYWFYASGGTAATATAMRNLTVQEL